MRLHYNKKINLNFSYSIIKMPSPLQECVKRDLLQFCKTEVDFSKSVVCSPYTKHI